MTAAQAPSHASITKISPYPGDYTGVPEMSYRPRQDSHVDPGEVVWAWVPFEDDPSRGKDRPALVIGFDGQWVLALPMSSKDRDNRGEDHLGRRWVEIGSGSWDAQGRESEVRVDRIVRLTPDGIRRNAGRVDAAVFARVADAVRRYRD